jgi:hypothetical protein
MQVLDRRRCVNARMGNQSSFRNEVVEPQQNVTDIEDDGLNLPESN